DQIDLTETTEQEEWKTRDEEVQDQSPRSKAPIALKELLQDENANATTNQLVESARPPRGGHQRPVDEMTEKEERKISKALKVLGETDQMREAMEDAIPECTAFLGQLDEQVHDDDEMMATGGGPLRETTERKHVMAVAGHHLLARSGQKEAWNMINSASPLRVIIKPPKDIYHKKLKEKIGRDVMTFMSDMAIQQASEYGKMLSQEFVQGSLQNKLGDVPIPLQELTGALARAIARAKMSDLATVETKMDDANSSLQCASCCTAPVSNNKDERSADPRVKQQVQKMHENMGHCSNENVVMVLKHGKARQAFIEAAQHLVCPSCEANKRPRLAKPSKAPTTYQFNGVIGMDIFFVLGLGNTTKVPMLNIACHGTGHQVAIPVPSRQGQQIRRQYRAFWKRVYGTPRVIVIDGEKGFSTGVFPDAAGAMNGDAELARSIGMRKAAMAAYIQTELPSTVWCSYQGGLLKCSPEQLRHANEGEISAWEQIDHTMKEEVSTENRGRRKYEDLTKQPAPSEEEVQDDVPPTAPPEPAGDDQPAAFLGPPTVEIERSSDVKADPIPMGPQYYDHLDDVPITTKKALVNPDAAVRVEQRIAAIEEKIHKGQQAPPKKKRRGKAQGATNALLTSAAQRGRKEVAEKSLVNTYKYQPCIPAKRREWGNIQKGSVFLILQTLCTNKWALQLADITPAFTAGGPLDSYVNEVWFQCSIFDGCVFYLRDDEGLRGVMGLTVDDIAGGGDQKFDEACRKLRHKFPFGAWRLKKGKYTGKELDQNDDNTEITISQCQSSANIQLIDIATERHGACAAPFRSWRGRAAPIPNLTVGDMLEANRIGRMTKEFCDVVLKVRHIPFHELAFAAFNDAAWANARDGASQAGYIAFATQSKILKGEAAIISIQSWKSRKLKRKCAHQFGAEALAISKGMAMAELIRTMLLEIVGPEFDLMRPCLLAGGLAEDKRAAIDVAIVRSAMQRPQVHLRWIEGASQLTDPPTKRKGESTLLRHALELGEYGITADSIVLRLDLYEMDCTGTLKRDYEEDDLNYEPEADRWIREAQEVYQAQTIEKPLHVHGDS
ncbi:unnamed protein product, partial [Prorocentrum cordatum]